MSFLVGGVLGRLAMRVLVLTSDDRIDGAITDDEAVVNQFTFSGTAGLALFIGLAGIALAWMYVGARHSLPASPRIRAGVWAALLWSAAGYGVFDPDGFDFTQLEPVWLGVVMFSAIFLAMGALIALGVERALERWPSHPVALIVPMLPMIPVAPLAAGGIVAAVGATINERWRAVQVFGALVMTAIVVVFGGPTAANVVRILV